MDNPRFELLRDEPITLFGDGSQTRSFCYVDNLIEAITRLMDTPDSFTGPLNIGNPVEITARELALLVIEMTNSNSELAFQPLPPYDPMQRQPDVALAGATLDWTPNTPPGEGLEKTIDYFRDILSGAPE